MGFGSGVSKTYVTTQIGDAKKAAVSFIIDGGGIAITTGEKGHIVVPFGGTITGVELEPDAAGSIVIDIWKGVYGGFPPTVANTITAAAKPTLVAQQKYQDLVLTGWTKTLTQGDILAFNVDSCATIKRITVTLYVTKS